jgi:hypothetical protein
MWTKSSKLSKPSKKLAVNTSDLGKNPELKIF